MSRIKVREVMLPIDPEIGEDLANTQRRTPDQGRCIRKRRWQDGCRALSGEDAVTMSLFLDVVLDEIPHLSDGASDDDDSGIQHADHVADANADVLAPLAECVESGFVPGACGRHDIGERGFGGEVTAVCGDIPSDRRTFRSIDLPASCVSATAGFATVDDGHVADLASGVTIAAEDASMNGHACPDARTERKEDEVG